MKSRVIYQSRIVDFDRIEAAADPDMMRTAHQMAGDWWYDKQYVTDIYVWLHSEKYLTDLEL